MISPDGVYDSYLLFTMTSIPIIDKDVPQWRGVDFMTGEFWPLSPL